MTAETGTERDRIGSWCGWVMTCAAALTPLLAWLGPLGFAPLMGLVGLLCLPAFRLPEPDRPLAIVLLLGLAWAAVSSLWSVHRPDELEDSVALKLALQLPLYWAAWCGARRADRAGRVRALKVFAWGLALYGALLLVEAFTGAGVYRALRDAIGDPIRPDLGRKNIAHGSFALALLWPVAAAAGLRAGAPAWLALPMAGGAAVVAQVFGSDAPVLAVLLAASIGVAVWAWPRTAPRFLAVGAAFYVLLMPVVVLALRGSFPHLQASWAQRVGYWLHALDAIAQHPFRGSGLDASRAFGPGIQLHPHNGALQIWLELGALGAVLAALVLAAVFRGLSRPERSLVSAAAAGSAAVYVLFGAVSFGVWQEWWLALGALAAVIATLAADGMPRTAAKPSTSTAISG